MLDGIVQSHPNDVAFIRHHVWWPNQPPYDPFYASDSFEIRRRRNYYPPWYSGGYAAPWGHIDGTQNGTTSQWATAVNQRLTVSSPLTMTLSGWYNRTSRQGRINVQVTNTLMAPLSKTYLCYALTETGKRYNAPNGEQVFGQVFRKYFANRSDSLWRGDTITIGAGATLNRGVNFSVRDTFNADSCQLVVFVQKDSIISTYNKEVIQCSKIWVRTLPSGVEISPVVEPATGVWLSAAEPTPFKDQTRISFSLPQEGPVSLSVYNLLGARVRTLVSGTKPAGSHSAVWDGRDNRGARVPGGVYFFELKTPYKTLTTRTVVVR